MNARCKRREALKKGTEGGMRSMRGTRTERGRPETPKSRAKQQHTRQQEEKEKNSSTLGHRVRCRCVVDRIGLDEPRLGTIPSRALHHRKPVRLLRLRACLLCIIDLGP